jgi:hypothetical protein
MVSMQALVRLTVWGFPVLLVAGCGGSEDGRTTTTAAPTTTVELRAGEVLFQDDFSDPTSGWASDVIEEGEFGYAEGAYRILTKPAGAQVHSARGGERVQALRLEVDATQVAGRGRDFVGVRCYTHFDDAGYELGIAPAEQGYGIGAFEGDEFRLLESSGEAVDVIRPVGEENQLRVECVSSPGGQSVLTLAANGEVLVRAEDATERPGFDGFGLFVGTTEGGAEALFDDFVATELVPR